MSGPLGALLIAANRSYQLIAGSTGYDLGYGLFGTGFIGTFSPTNVLPGTGTLIGFYDWGTASGPTVQASVAIAGLGADPTKKFLAFAAIKGAAKAGTSANSYTYSGGTSIWLWSSTFGFANGGTYGAQVLTTG